MFLCHVVSLLSIRDNSAHIVLIFRELGLKSDGLSQVDDSVECQRQVADNKSLETTKTKRKRIAGFYAGKPAPKCACPIKSVRVLKTAHIQQCYRLVRAGTHVCMCVRVY